MEPTLQQILGADATQDANTITIQKADLPGLTASANNRAESLLVAMLLKAMSYLNQANFDANTDQSLLITQTFQSLTTRGTDTYRRTDLTVALHKVDNSGVIDPDDY